MGWREGEDAGKRKDGLSSASIIASTTRAHHTGLGLGACTAGRSQEAHEEEEEAARREKNPGL